MVRLSVRRLIGRDAGRKAEGSIAMVRDRCDGGTQLSLNPSQGTTLAIIERQMKAHLVVGQAGGGEDGDLLPAGH